MKLKCNKWSYLEKREGKNLLIWPDLPRWMVIDNELLSFLNLIKKENELDIIIRQLSKTLKKDPSDVESQIRDVIPILIKNGIISNGVKKTNIQNQPKFKLEDVSINVTTRCNLNCKMCFNKYDVIKNIEEIDFKFIKKFLDQIKPFCTDDTNISISGGEALIVKDKTLKVAEYAKKIGFNTVAIITNGTLINKEFAKKVKELDLKILVSLDGINEEQHDFVRGKGNFKRTIKGIKILKEEGVFVATNFMAHKQNYQNLEQYYKLALKLGVNKARFISFKRMGAGNETNELEVVPVNVLLDHTYKMFQKHPEFKKLTGIEYLSAFASQCRLTVKRGWCGTAKTVVLLDADGSIYPCVGHAFPQFKAGNIKEKDFDDIWFDSPILKKLRKTYDVDSINEECTNCIVKHWCLACRSEAYQVSNKLNSTDPQCKIKKQAIIDMFWKISDNPELGKGKVNLAH